MPSRYKNISVTVICLPDVERKVKKIFFDILEDYCKRFRVKVTKNKIKVQIALIEYPEDSMTQGMTLWTEHSTKILVQVRDPFLNDYGTNPYIMDKFLNIMCHEFVHAAQQLTGRTGITIANLKFNKKDDSEKYFFEPCEMEARLFESPYTNMYAHILT